MDEFEPMRIQRAIGIRGEGAHQEVPAEAELSFTPPDFPSLQEAREVREVRPPAPRTAPVTAESEPASN